MFFLCGGLKVTDAKHFHALKHLARTAPPLLTWLLSFPVYIEQLHLVVLSVQRPHSADAPLTLIFLIFFFAAQQVLPQAGMHLLPCVRPLCYFCFQVAEHPT